MARNSVRHRASGRGGLEAPLPIQGDMLRQAIDWAFEEQIFANGKRHGNTGWITRDLLRLVG